MSAGLLATVPSSCNGNRNNNSETGFPVEASHETAAPSGKWHKTDGSCGSVAVKLCLMKNVLFVQAIRCRSTPRETGKAVSWCTCREIHKPASAHTSRVGTHSYYTFNSSVSFVSGWRQKQFFCLVFVTLLSPTSLLILESSLNSRLCRCQCIVLHSKHTADSRSVISERWELSRYL